MLHIILMVLAFLLFLAAGVGMTYKNLQFGWLGAAALTAALFLGAR